MPPEASSLTQAVQRQLATVNKRVTQFDMDKTGYNALADMRSRKRDKAFRTEFVMPLHGVRVTSRD